MNCDGGWANSTDRIHLILSFCMTVWTWVKTRELAQPRTRRQQKHAICNNVILAPKPLHMLFMSFLIFPKFILVFLLASWARTRLQSLPIREMVDAGWSCDGWCSATLPSDCLVLRGPRYRPDSSEWLVLIRFTPLRGKLSVFEPVKIWIQYLYRFLCFEAN